MLYIFVFRIGVNFGHDTFYLLKFQIDDVVHDALGECYVLLEQIEIEVGIRFERIDTYEYRLMASKRQES